MELFVAGAMSGSAFFHRGSDSLIWLRLPRLIVSRGLILSGYSCPASGAGDSGLMKPLGAGSRSRSSSACGSRAAEDVELAPPFDAPSPTQRHAARRGVTAGFVAGSGCRFPAFGERPARRDAARRAR